VKEREGTGPPLELKVDGDMLKMTDLLPGYLENSPTQLDAEKPDKVKLSDVLWTKNLRMHVLLACIVW